MAPAAPSTCTIAASCGICVSRIIYLYISWLSQFADFYQCSLTQFAMRTPNQRLLAHNVQWTSIRSSANLFIDSSSLSFGRTTRWGRIEATGCRTSLNYLHKHIERSLRLSVLNARIVSESAAFSRRTLLLIGQTVCRASFAAVLRLRAHRFG